MGSFRLKPGLQRANCRRPIFRQGCHKLHRLAADGMGDDEPPRVETLFPSRTSLQLLPLPCDRRRSAARGGPTALGSDACVRSRARFPRVRRDRLERSGGMKAEPLCRRTGLRRCDNMHAPTMPFVLDEPINVTAAGGKIRHLQPTPNRSSARPGCETVRSAVRRPWRSAARGFTPDTGASNRLTTPR